MIEKSEADITNPSDVQRVLDSVKEMVDYMTIDLTEKFDGRYKLVITLEEICM